MEKIKVVPKGGNSPIRFFLMIDDEKIGMFEVREKVYRVHVYKKEYQSEIVRYMHETQKIERFYWGYLPN